MAKVEGRMRRERRCEAMEARREPFLAFEERAVRAFGVEVVEEKMEV